MGKVLVVDDDKSYRDMLALQLRKKGHEPVLAADGQEALEKANPNQEALVIDLQLPDGGGCDFLAKLRAKGITAFAILVSGDLREEYVEGCELLDVFDVHQKGNGGLSRLLSSINAAVDFTNHAKEAYELVGALSGNNGKVCEAS